MICTGAKTIDNIKKSAEYLVSRLKVAGLNLEQKTEVKVQNIVATADLLYPIDLEKVLRNPIKTQEAHAIYEPEQFPAIILKLKTSEDRNPTILIFSTGKLVCVGLTNYASVQATINFVTSKIKESSV